MNYTILPKAQSWLWWLAPESGTVIGTVIYFPDRWFTLAEPERSAWLLHETTHIAQRLSWWRYLTSARYRREVELEAYRVQVQYLLSHGRTPNIDSWARVMSEYGVLRWITEEEAREALGQWIG